MTRRTGFVLLCCATLCAFGAERKTKAVILVTADGVRWQDVFHGIDERLMNEKTAGMGDKAAAALRDRLAKSTPEARREALMPFFWKGLAPHGVVLGNVG